MTVRAIANLLMNFTDLVRPLPGSGLTSHSFLGVYGYPLITLAFRR